MGLDVWNSKRSLERKKKKLPKWPMREPEVKCIIDVSSFFENFRIRQNKTSVVETRSRKRQRRLLRNEGRGAKSLHDRTDMCHTLYPIRSVWAKYFFFSSQFIYLIVVHRCTGWWWRGDIRVENEREKQFFSVLFFYSAATIDRK